MSNEWPVCQCCGKTRDYGRKKWCVECAVKIAYQNTRKAIMRWWRKKHPRPPCQVCGKRLEPRKRKWCASCGPVMATKRLYQRQRDYRERRAAA